VRVRRAAALYTGYDPQSGYKHRIRTVGTGSTAQDIKTLRERFMFVRDTRDLCAASDLLKRLLGIPMLGCTFLRAYAKYTVM